MKILNEDLKTKQFAQCYLLYGEEMYLKKQYKDKLKDAMIASGDTMNYTYFEGKGINVKEVIDLAETLPFFSECRLIVLENSGFFKNASPELAEYIKEMPETTRIVFVESEVDKRGKLYKAVKAKGRIVELGRQEEAILVRWIAKQVQKEQKQMTERTIRYFLTKVGIDMENIQKELEKLFCYTLEKSEITMEDVETICTTQIANQIFDMVEAVANQQQKKALDYYYDLMALKEPPLRILFHLTRQFRLLLEIKEMEKLGYPKKEIAQKVGVPPFYIGKYQEQARAFSKKELRGILEYSVEIEEHVKTGKLTDSLAVEIFIVKYSAKK